LTILLNFVYIEQTFGYFFDDNTNDCLRDYFFMILLLTLRNYIDNGTIAFALAYITKEYKIDRIKWGIY